jgi:uncharacterized membrane protein YcaP (DUF421 family)
MDSVVRATAIYFVVWMLFRIAGKRTLSEATPFDFVLLLIIGETTQQALLGQDFSLTNAILLIATLIGIDVLLSVIKQRSARAERILDGRPVLVLENGRLLEDRMRRERVDREDILEAARRLQGLERIDQIKHAVLEPSGGISIVPR